MAKPAEVLKPYVAAKTVTRIENTSTRKAKVVAEDGSVREMPVAEVAARVLAQGIAVEYDDAVARREQRIRDLKRRAKGLSDECDGCGDALSMVASAVRYRDTKGHPWKCKLCATARGGIRKQKPTQDIERRAIGLPDLCDDCGKPLGMSRASQCLRDESGHPWRCCGCSQKKRRAEQPQRASDCCRRCNAPLSMTKSCVSSRRRGKSGWMCRSCAHSKSAVEHVDRCSACDQELSNGRPARNARRRKYPNGAFLCRKCSIPLDELKARLGKAALANRAMPLDKRRERSQKAWRTRRARNAS